MRLHHARLPLTFIAALAACTARHDGPDADAIRVPAPAEVTHPMASFARLVPGEWQMMFGNGTTSGSISTWHWGPGKHSIHRADVVDVYYWHPGLKQVRTLGLDPYARGVSEGTIQFEGETAETTFDLYQTSGHRRLVMQWTFDGPDKYHEALFEPTSTGGLAQMSDWNHVRSHTATPPRPRTAGEAPQPSERLQALEPLLVHAWEATGTWDAGEAGPIRTDIELIAGVDGIYARTVALTDGGEPVHLLDTYFYHHTGTGSLRCLALSNPGGVYEGDITVLEGGSLQIDLRGYEGDQVVSRVGRFDFEQDGALHSRVWTLEGTDRQPMLDMHHKRVEPTQD